MKQRVFLLLSLLVLSMWTRAQAAYVDSAYTYQQTSDISYGQAVDFAGNVRDLTMDICVPVGDNPGPNGRPLMVLVHGGAFIAGSKADPNIVRMMHEFAERGYVTAAINYRLGMFNSEQERICHISDLFDIPWTCLNQQDSSEWFRAAYRGAQDAHGAIRFLINQAGNYAIDPSRVFLVGESAGAFIALEAAYLDESIEKLAPYGPLPNALPPFASAYEVKCIQTYGFDTSIASMSLARPDLGSVRGTMNPTAIDYTIKGVGSFYGGMMHNLLGQSACANPAVLYMFHQYDDLIVPIGNSYVLQGYQDCFYGVCGYIFDRARSMGSKAIRQRIDTYNAIGNPGPDYIYRFDSTNSNTGCGQVNVPYVGHSIDNFDLRTHNMAVFFNNYIGTNQGCTVVDAAEPVTGHLIVYPNPTQGQLRIRTSAGDQLHRATLRDLQGKTLHAWDFPASPEQQITLPDGLAHGLYLLQVETQGGSLNKVISLQ